MLYWAMLAGNDELGNWFKDCFTDNRAFEPDWKRFEKPYKEAKGASLVFYGHGSLILGCDVQGQERKLASDKSSPILDTIAENWTSDKFAPLFVSEGTSAAKGPLRNKLTISPPIHPVWRRRSAVEYGEYSPFSLLPSPASRRRSWPTYFCAGPKLAAIRRSPYLSEVYNHVLKRRFCNKNVVVYGFSFAEHDDHIIDALAAAPPKKMAVSVYQDNDAQSAQAFCHKVLSRLRAKITKDVPICFFDSASPGCWNHFCKTGGRIFDMDFGSGDF